MSDRRRDKAGDLIKRALAARYSGLPLDPRPRSLPVLQHRPRRPYRMPGYTDASPSMSSDSMSSDAPDPLVTRFAPSPTGYLHLGNARTALLNFLAARKAGGRFILRVEDTDEARSNEDFMAALFADLKWLGLDWDEGPDIGGPHKIYRQQQRRAIYEEWSGAAWTRRG